VFLTARVGRLASRLRVTGNRVWRENGAPGRGLVPSEPEPFTEMPVAYTRAFGGKADFQGQLAAWPDNPDGVGYYLTRDQAVGRPLPNVEPADGPFLRTWEDRPPVAGWGPYPMFWGLRAREAVSVDAQAKVLKHVRPRVHNNAHPALIADKIEPGEIIQVEGLREAPLQFRVPRELAQVRVEVGERTSDVHARIDGVHVWADAGKVVVVQRVSFPYVVRPRELRQATVALAAA
jgi:hypothetical protein